MSFRLEKKLLLIVASTSQAVRHQAQYFKNAVEEKNPPCNYLRLERTPIF